MLWGRKFISKPSQLTSNWTTTKVTRHMSDFCKYTWLMRAAKYTSYSFRLFMWVHADEWCTSFSGKAEHQLHLLKSLFHSVWTNLLRHWIPKFLSSWLLCAQLSSCYQRLIIQFTVDHQPPLTQPILPSGLEQKTQQTSHRLESLRCSAHRFCMCVTLTVKKWVRNKV